MEMTPRPCPLCQGDMVQEEIAYATPVADGAVIVTGVPALVCRQCGHELIYNPTAAEIERLVAERPVPTRYVRVPVYELRGGHYEPPVPEATRPVGPKTDARIPS